MARLITTNAAWKAPLAAVLFAAFGGAVLALGSPLFSAALLAMVLGVYALFVSSWSLFVFLFVLTFYIQGSVKFFVGSNALGWATAGLGLLLLVKVIYESAGTRAPRDTGRRALPPAALVALTIYLLIFAGSVIINLPSPLQFVSAFKNAIPMVSVLAAVYLLPWNTDRLNFVWKLLLGGVFVQLPLVVYQHFFVADQRKTQGWDAVVGTLGGNPEGGGLNAMLIVFCLAGLAYAIARVRQCRSPAWMGWITGLCVVAIVMLGEVKAAFVWMPLVFLFFFGRVIARRPGRALAFAAVGAVLLGSIFFAYQKFYWKGTTKADDTLAQKISRQSTYFFDPSNIDFRTGEVSRGASLAIWWGDAKAHTLSRSIGYGPGASKSVSILGLGEVARRYYPLSIDATACAVLLWDVGIAGFLAYSAMIFLGLFAGVRLVRASRRMDGQTVPLIEASIVTLGLLSTFLIYNRSLTDEPTAQFLLYFTLGVILRFSSSPPANAADSTSPASVMSTSKVEQRSLLLRGS